MLDYYSNPRTLFKSILEGNIRTICRCLNAGQILNQPFTPSWTTLYKNDPLWLVALLTHRDSNAFKSSRITETILAFKKKIDINETESFRGGNALWVTPIIPEIWHLFIQNGIDVNHKDDDGNVVMHHIMQYSDHDDLVMMLLSAGANPPKESTSRKVRDQVGRWLSGLATAKATFKDIFDNAALEKELCEFIYAEKYLLKAIGQ